MRAHHDGSDGSEADTVRDVHQESGGDAFVAVYEVSHGRVAELDEQGHPLVEADTDQAGHDACQDHHQVLRKRQS